MLRRQQSLHFRNPSEALIAAGQMQWWDDKRAERLLMQVIELVVKEPKRGETEEPKN